VLKRFAIGILARSLLRELSAIRRALEVHNAHLGRIADHLCPTYPEDRDTLKRDTGVTHLDPIDAGLALDFVARTQRDTGHVPDEDEILIYLADEKTTDLHKRLIERDDELARLQESRQ
jgi:hypothetical protein